MWSHEDLQHHGKLPLQQWLFVLSMRNRRIRWTVDRPHSQFHILQTGRPCDPILKEQEAFKPHFISLLLRCTAWLCLAAQAYKPNGFVTFGGIMNRVTCISYRVDHQLSSSLKSAGHRDQTLQTRRPPSSSFTTTTTTTMEALKTKSARPPAMKLRINVPLTTTLNLLRERLPRAQNSNHLQQNYNLYSNERHHPLPSSSPLHAVCETSRPPQSKQHFDSYQRRHRPTGRPESTFLRKRSATRMGEHGEFRLLRVRCAVHCRSGLRLWKVLRKESAQDRLAAKASRDLRREQPRSGREGDQCCLH